MRAGVHPLHPAPVLVLPQPWSCAPADRPPVPRGPYQLDLQRPQEPLLGDNSSVVQHAHGPRPRQQRQPCRRLPLCRLHLPRHGRASQVRPGQPRVPDRRPPVHWTGVNHVLKQQDQAELQPPVQGACLGRPARLLC